MPSPKYDVFVTFGHPNDTTLQQMRDYLQAILHDANGPTPNTVAQGRGQWGDYSEHSYVLLFTDLFASQANTVRDAMVQVGTTYEQDAVGVAVIPAGSALIETSNI